MVQKGEPGNGQEFIRCVVCGDSDQQLGTDRAAGLAAMNAAMATHLATHTQAQRDAALLRLSVTIGTVTVAGVKLL